MATLDGAVDLARDRELVQRCQMGDESSFTELYDRYHRRLHRFCLRRLHSHDDAEEAVQEAFARAWRALPKFGGDRRFYPWLTVIAGNVCTDMLRRSNRIVPMHEMPRRAVEIDGGEDIDAHLLRQVDLAMATEAFSHLSDRHQRVLRLRESTEWSAQRIAESEGVAVPAVDTLLWRARQAFKREFTMLSEAGGLAGLVGIGVAALRRGLARSWLRVASHAPGPLRGPGALAATVALTGAAIAGGGVALVGVGPAPRHASIVSTPSTSSVKTSSAKTSSAEISFVETSSASGLLRAATGTSTHRRPVAGAPAKGAEGFNGGRGSQKSKRARRSGGAASAPAGVLGSAGSGRSAASAVAGAGLGQIVSAVGGHAGSIGGGTSSTSTLVGTASTAASRTVRTASTTSTGTVTTSVQVLTTSTSSLGTATTSTSATTGSSGAGSLPGGL
ncbi:MAG: RNA polymerase sigma factor [Actinomycetota bacterium]|nr:RNA polymerase sigma factor [Actinomycetota bacterium]